MKHFPIKGWLTWIVLLSLLTAGFSGCIKDCQPVEVPPNNEKECRALRMGLQQYDSLLVSLVLSEAIRIYEPFPSGTDTCGHETNLLELKRLLNQSCGAYIQAEVDCYRCVEAIPRRSRLILTLYRPDTTMVRILEILTPCNDHLALWKITDP